MTYWTKLLLASASAISRMPVMASQNKKSLDIICLLMLIQLNHITARPIMNSQAIPSAAKTANFKLDNLPQLSPMVARMLILDTVNNQAENEFLLIIQSEPALAARLISLANSVLRGARGQPTTTLRQALRRIGLESAKFTAIGILCIRPLQLRLAPSIRQSLWLHSLTMGFMARAIAVQLHFPEPESAYLAGLMHDIGFMALEVQQPGALRQRVETAQESNLSLHEAENKLFGIDHTRLTASLLHEWRFPPSLVHSLAVHHQNAPLSDSLAAILISAENLIGMPEMMAALYGTSNASLMALQPEAMQTSSLILASCGLGCAEVEKLQEMMLEQITGLHAMAIAA